ncbi:MAG: FG-GAP-like repeat-containing protein [Gemmatimonadota bacterium]|uniref:FG-GAP-like repeat-containing protein n=1 Tax=Candidatus Palauibacter polyketidifaciens TaxID=3056740 RepID=UPI00239F62EA|nr:FG-GAP-like repeat-containing protein [Candidatus Palauibacter polyketidifaciens]MDE2720986.1 FG-GAP-like repeat-containing protein [Candidatus Palauibacter polyketidifaciens]
MTEPKRSRKSSLGGAPIRVCGLTFLALIVGCGEAGAPVPEASLAEILATRGTADAALQQDRLEDARIDYQRLVEMAPAEAAGYAGLGLTALKAADYETAEENLIEARERAPDDPELALALATLRTETGDFGEARALLDETLAADPGHARSLWGLAEVEARAAGPDSDARADVLARLAAAAPGNLAALAALADAQLARGELDAALGTMESLRQLAPDFRPGPRAAFEAAEDALLDGDASTAIGQLADFRAAFEVTSPYQASLDELRQPGGPLAGVAALDFSFLVTLRVQEPEAVLASLRYTNASTLAGLVGILPAHDGTPPPATIATGDFDGDGDEDLLWSHSGIGRVLRIDLGRYVDTSGDLGTLDAGEAEAAAIWVDFDDDRRLDVWFAGRSPRAYHNDPAGGFREIALPSAATGEAGDAANDVFAADLDQDGDLDLFEPHTGANRLFRNNGDLTFAEMAVDFGLAGPADADTRDAAFGDLDNDRDLDIVLAEGSGGLRLLDNERAATFADRTDRLGAEGEAAAEEALAVAVGDVNGDGRLDIVAAGGDRVRLLHGSADDFALAATVPLNGLVPRDLLLVDFDNDGRLDLAVAGSPPGPASGVGFTTGPGLRLFRNEGNGRLVPADEFLPDVASGDFRDVRSFDYNEDGDADLLLLGGDGHPTLFRNDGGNANHYFRLDLAGLGEGSRKNNRFGIGARVEVRAGDLFQVHTVTDPTTLIGLDGRLKADVVRVYWPNGVPQDLYFPGTDQDLVEEQTLKGSCPMLYVWDGDGFEFVGDMMWKSALGMPLGILGGGQRAYAPAFPSQEYRRLPDGVLQPLDGEYVMQITEELWETIYVDGVNLVSVDHPSEIDVYVNEAFIPPAPIDLELWRVGERHAPVSAMDESGRDHRDALAERDFDYVSAFRPGRFQGIAEPHELILDLGPEAASGDVTLFLTGWIFPTDASINVALGQSDALAPHFPELDVMGPGGEWQPAVPGLSFPSGKDKTVVADLRGLFPTDDRRVRIRTNLMVYWDEAFFTTGPAHPAADEHRVTSLAPRNADIHYRGFAREFRKGGRYGPHWFDYDSVTVEPRWHDLFGLYTRFGDVTDLVTEGDDRYVIQNAGDEITLRFDAEAFPALPEGWRRTFLIYSDGWVKDGDLNTATGDRVVPLPARTLSGYPPSPEEGRAEAPDAALADYLTRVIPPPEDR